MSGLPMVLLAQVAEPEGYRTQQYRAAVPSELSGGTVITTPEAEALWREGQAAFVDVLPQAPKPANLPEGTIWRDNPATLSPARSGCQILVTARWQM
jgi:PQQ-dependent catabolism-associated CXXCW motif protein